MRRAKTHRKPPRRKQKSFAPRCKAKASRAKVPWLRYRPARTKKVESGGSSSSSLAEAQCVSIGSLLYGLEYPDKSGQRSVVDHSANFNCMKPEEIVLLPATHESVACFHVKEELLLQFLQHLENAGIEVTEPPQPQGNPEMPYVKVNVKEGVPEKRLQQVLDDFQNKR